MQLTNGAQTNSRDSDSTHSDSMSFYSCTSGESFPAMNSNLDTPLLSKINTSEAKDEQVIYYYFIIKYISNFLSYYYLKFLQFLSLNIIISILLLSS